MRAICEACQRPQPVDWKPGDLCIHCGHAVRRDVRCFWCVKPTPASGKYCRTCGAAVVEDRLFGAARMLKDAGVDRFAVPRMLAELDPDQIENYLNIYQRHASVMVRHVEDVRFLESFLEHQLWSDALEEHLIVQLPWPDARLNALSGARSGGERLARARSTSAGSPFELTRSLASVVRLLLGDFEAQREVWAVFGSSNSLLQAEAALALSNWRVLYGPGIEGGRYELLDALRKCPFTQPAAVHLAMLGDAETELPPAALVSRDPDVAFSAALAVGDIDRLIAAELESDPSKRSAAAARLIGLKCFNGVEAVIRQADVAVQVDLLRAIGRVKKADPGLHDLCVELMETSSNPTVCESASGALKFCRRPGDTLRVARAARGNRRIYQDLLQTTGTKPEELSELCDFLVREGVFSASQWGMADNTKEGRLPPEFVPHHWRAASESARVELCKLAEMQLGQYADESLHRFMVSVAFGDEAFAVQQTAWTSLYRWYKQSDYSGMGPLRIETASLERFFGSPAAFVPLFTRFLGAGDPRPILQDLFVREPLTKLLRYADANSAPLIAATPREALALVGALRALMALESGDFILRLACIDFLALLAAQPELRQPVIDLLNSFRGTDLDHGVSMGLDKVS